MNIIKAILAGAIILCSASFAAAQTSDEKRTVDFYNGFLGRWEGQLSATASEVFNSRSPEEIAAEGPIAPISFAFTITASSVKVFTKAKAGEWTEAKAGNFRLLTGSTNAVLFAITSGGGDDGWVETWNFTITHKERDSLDVVWTRAVNNFSHSSDYKKKLTGGYESGRFFSVRYGEMTRPDTTAK